MISIKAVKSYIPEGQIDVAARASNLNVKDDFLKNKLGIESLSSLSKNDETSDIAVNAVQSLVSDSELELNDIECLVLCTQNPDELGLSLIHI